MNNTTIDLENTNISAGCHLEIAPRGRNDIFQKGVRKGLVLQQLQSRRGKNKTRRGKNKTRRGKNKTRRGKNKTRRGKNKSRGSKRPLNETQFRLGVDCSTHLLGIPLY